VPTAEKTFTSPKNFVILAATFCIATTAPQAYNRLLRDHWQLRLVDYFPVAAF
jgi:hypothetical protein